MKRMHSSFAILNRELRRGRLRYFNRLICAGAEALLERHQEYRTEIDARAATFQVYLQA